jgi:uncharacterized protein
MLIYLDSVIVIYFLGYGGPFQHRAKARINALDAAGDRIATSDLVRLECRVQPIARGDLATLRTFDRFFRRQGIAKLRLTKAVYDRATVLRATYRFKPVDSLHLAAAIEGRCGLFLTNDQRLSRCPDIAIEVLP